VQCSGSLSRRVSAEEVDPRLTVYPDYCNGIFYMTNPATAARLVTAARTEKYLYIDDVFVTGFLREKLNISLVDTYEFQASSLEPSVFEVMPWILQTYSVKALVKSKAVQSVHTHLPDYINGLLPRDDRQDQVGALNYLNFTMLHD
jgi:hypothetical protein